MVRLERAQAAPYRLSDFPAVAALDPAVRGRAVGAAGHGSGGMMYGSSPLVLLVAIWGIILLAQLLTH